MTLALGAQPAAAVPDSSGSVIITEDNGFPGVCGQPCFNAEKTFEVFLDGNPTGPGVCPAGNNTFLYTIQHLGGTGPFVPSLTKFEVGVVNTAVNVTSAGFIPGPLDPSATILDAGNDVVTWDFLAPPIANGQLSSQLFICSPLPAGSVTDNTVSVDGQASLDAPGTCVGPFEPDGDPFPCTIGFWKQLAEEDATQRKHFPGAQYDPQLLDAAAGLSGGFFADGTALEAALTSNGKRTQQQKAEQQLAALLLSLAAGDLFNGNGKCQLFESNELDGTNACTGDATIEDALASILANMAAGSFEDAKDCADDLNNGIGVVGANMSD